MSIVKKYVITLGAVLIILVVFLTMNVHYGSQIHVRNQSIAELRQPKEIKVAHELTGKKEQAVSPFTLMNDNEKQQVKFAQGFLTNHFTYNTAESYADNRNQSQKEMTSSLWDRVKKNEFSDQKNRIGESIISENRSTSNFISANPYVASDTYPEHNMTKQNVPIYYLVTSSYTDNQDDNAKSGKQATLIKMQVDANRSLVSDYQVLARSNFE